jgi:dTMP kinase
MKIIAFCGIDGSGKSTQVERVQKELSKRNIKSYISKVKYYPFWHYFDEMITHKEMRIYMAFHFAQHYLELLPILEEQGYDCVLCDEHKLRHLTYAKTNGFENIALLDSIFSLAPKPDMTFYFDITSDIAMERIIIRRAAGHHSVETKETITPTIENYKKLLSTEQYSNVVWVEALQSTEALTAHIVSKILTIC